MKKIYTIVSRVSQSEFIARDALGRRKLLQSSRELRIGEAVLVANGVIIRNVSTKAEQTFNV